MVHSDLYAFTLLSVSDAFASNIIFLNDFEMEANFDGGDQGNILDDEGDICLSYCKRVFFPVHDMALSSDSIFIAFQTAEEILVYPTKIFLPHSMEGNSPIEVKHVNYFCSFCGSIACDMPQAEKAMKTIKINIAKLASNISWNYTSPSTNGCNKNCLLYVASTESASFLHWPLQKADITYLRDDYGSDINYIAGSWCRSNENRAILSTGANVVVMNVFPVVQKVFTIPSITVSPSVEITGTFYYQPFP